jgi:threonine dehydrogenase-like Zn-dependent dehydrogenase
MKALVYQGPYEIHVAEVESARIEHPNDVVLRLTTTCKLEIDWGLLWQKGIRLGTGQCDCKRYQRRLRDLIVAGRAQPSFIVSHELPLADGPDAYDKFDRRVDGYTQVALKPAA